MGVSIDEDYQVLLYVATEITFFDSLGTGWQIIVKKICVLIVSYAKRSAAKDLTHS